MEKRYPMSSRFSIKVILTQVIILAIIALFCGESLYAQDEELNIKKSKHFIVYYSEASAEYAGKVAREAERYYNSIIKYLGFNRFDFWTWDKRCKIYLYPTQEEYQIVTDSESWSNGKVHVTKKEIFTYAAREQFLDYILPHEMGHIIFREAVGFDKNLPLWLDEGIATLQEKDQKKYLLTARSLVNKESFVSLRELSSIIGYGEISPLVFYSESASIMNFLLEKFGKRRFVAFCHRLRDGEEWQEALLKTYKAENLEELGQKWVKSLTD